MNNEVLKARLSALVVLSVMNDPDRTAEYVQRAQQVLRGWTFHAAFQYVSGKRFLAVMKLTDDVELRATWALAHVFAKEFAGTNNWSGSARPRPLI